MAKELTGCRVEVPISEDLAERMYRFLVETCAKYENAEVGGTVRLRTPEEAGLPAVRDRRRQEAS